MDINEHHNLTYNVRLGVRYHMKRQAFFERWHRLTGIVSLVGGSSAVVAIASSTNNITAAALAATIAIAQCIDLIVDTRKNADLHRDLRCRYTGLEAKLLKSTAKNSEYLEAITQEVKIIERDEPPLKITLMNVCQNELIQFMGYKKEECSESWSKVGMFGKVFKQFI